jgi:hypothetical protein
MRLANKFEEDARKRFEKTRAMKCPHCSAPNARGWQYMSSFKIPNSLQDICSVCGKWYSIIIEVDGKGVNIADGGSGSTDSKQVC